MADALWPVPKFHFTVEGANFTTGFQEVTGLEHEINGIDYRAGDDPTFIMQKIPGLKKFSDITLKKGVFADDTAFADWFHEASTDVERREDIVISLLDEEATPVAVWTVNDAFPIKYSAPDLKADANEIATESLVLTHQGIERTQ